MKFRWNTYLRYLLNIIGLVVIMLIVFQFIISGYQANWSGFGERVLSNGEIVPAKTLWDWIELLVIPLVLSISAFLLNLSGKNIERKFTEKRAELDREIAKDSQEEAALQAYINYMTELLLEKKLKTAKSEEIRTIARIRTLTVLRRLNARRKGDVMDFINEAELINLPNPIVNLSGADLSNANLIGADLSNTHLQYVNLKGARLHFAHLDGADLLGSNLPEAELYSATLKGTNLTSVNLNEAFLNGANLYEANLLLTNFTNATLSRAYLKGAKIMSGQLAIAKPLKGATMPDGTKHE